VGRLRKERPDLTYDQAAAEVFKADPQLWEDYRHAVAFPGVPSPKPVAKETLTDEVAMAEAEALTKREPGLTIAAALGRLAEQHPDQRVYNDLYRQCHFRARHTTLPGTTAGEAGVRVQKSVYDTMWG
jgi:hypothetical protein